MSKTFDERERLLSEVEDLMLRGINRAATICRMVSGIGNNRTAARYIAMVSERWRDRNVVDNESHRQRLLAETQEIHKRAFALVAQMSNLDQQTPASGSAAATALGVALKSLERQAKLLGLDSERRVVDAGAETLEALRDRILAEPLDRPAVHMLYDGVDPIKEAGVHLELDNDYGHLTTV